MESFFFLLTAVWQLSSVFFRSINPSKPTKIRQELQKDKFSEVKETANTSRLGFWKETSFQGFSNIFANFHMNVHYLLESTRFWMSCTLYVHTREYPTGISKHAVLECIHEWMSWNQWYHSVGFGLRFNQSWRSPSSLLFNPMWYLAKCNEGYVWQIHSNSVIITATFIIAAQFDAENACNSLSCFLSLSQLKKECTKCTALSEWAPVQSTQDILSWRIWRIEKFNYYK